MSTHDQLHDAGLEALFARAGDATPIPPAGWMRVEEMLRAPGSANISSSGAQKGTVAATAGSAGSGEEASLESLHDARRTGLGGLGRQRGTRHPHTPLGRGSGNRHSLPQTLTRPWVGLVAAALVGVSVLTFGGASAPGGGGVSNAARGDARSSQSGGGTSVGLPAGPTGTSEVAPGALTPPTAPQIGAPADAGKNLAGTPLVSGALPRSTPAGAGTSQPGVSDGALVIRTASLDIQTRRGEVRQSANRVEVLAANAHGYVSTSTLSQSGTHPAASVSIRVPEAAFVATLASLRGLGEVRGENQQGADVTAQHADTQARLRALQSSRERYLALLAQAKTIGEVLTVQQRIDEVQSQIESMQAQVASLERQSAYSSIEVRLSEPGDTLTLPEPVKPQGAWSRAWHQGVDGFTSGVQSIIAGSGRALLVGVCAGILWFALRRGWLLYRRRQMGAGG